MIYNVNRRRLVFRMERARKHAKGSLPSLPSLVRARVSSKFSSLVLKKPRACYAGYNLSDNFQSTVTVVITFLQIAMSISFVSSLIQELGVKARQYFISSCCMFLHKTTVIQMLLNPELNLTVFPGTQS